ncbi:anti-sigma factor RsbA family regulatory protein [Actinoplanes sp. NPDC049596]|uniref:anti-sigma factor RsbA family regulatory protein n=1 Tax=unclassified Actinoplanes TaxID=2626549 RepID=UPI00341DF70B
MRSGAAAGHRGCFHETAFYDSDQTFLDVVGPFLAGGLAAGEPVVSAFAGHNQTLVLGAFGPRSGIRFLDGGVQYARPASAIDRYRRVLRDYVVAGAEQIRVAGQVPHPGSGVPWEWWVRYEAALNRVFGGVPVWGLCPYDLRQAPSQVLDDARSTHPYVATGDEHAANPAFVAPEEFLAGRRSRWRDPLEATEPAATFHDPLPARVRAAVAQAGPSTTLGENDIRGLILGASEAVSNAIRHGRPPVTVRLWSSLDRILVTVTDTGDGPSDPYAGLQPSPGGGLGLWLAFQSCGYVTLDRGPAGFTVRLLAGRAEP